MESRSSGQQPVSLDEYLAVEERSPFRHEYVAGDVYEMAGATTRHNVITLNIAARLREELGSRCRVFATDVKLRVQDRIYYPDVMVACGPAGEVESVVEQPVVLVEVTSQTTRRTDRCEKLDCYRSIPGLRLYLIVEQRRRHVLSYVRPDGDDWAREELVHDGVIVVPPYRTELSLDHIYEGLRLPPLTVGEDGTWDYGDGEVGAES